MQKQILAAAISAIMVYPVAAPALDTKISGHVNRMIRYASDGDRSDVQFTDNTASQSRFRFNTSGDIGGGVTAGIIYEAGLVSNVSGLTPLKSGDSADQDATVNMRHSAIYLEGNFGRVTLGQSGEAADGILFADLSGTFLGDEASNFEHGSAIAWNIDGVVADATLGDTMVAPDGSRRDMFRYDTPNLGGFGIVSASVNNDSRWSVGTFLGGSAGGGEWQFNAGYLDTGGGDRTHLFAASGSYLFSQGTNITLAYGEQDSRDGDSDFLYGKLGHKFGDNAVSVSYSTGTVENAEIFTATETSAAVVADADVDVLGLAFQRNLPKVGIEFYSGYHWMMGDFDGTRDPDDIHIFVVGSRIKFN